MDEFPDALERLTARVEALEKRLVAIEALEHPSTAEQSAPVARQPFTPQTAEAGEGLSFTQAGGVFSVLGKAMLGIAGAYLLRAVAESSSLPRLAIAAVAIVYALLWLVAAVRVPVEAWFASTVYAGTSALILAPMLWELTLRFKVLPAPATAGILCAFVIAATALAWKQDRTPVFWVANLAAAGSALALSIATHELAPFIAALLVMAVLCEYAAGRGHQLGVRPLVAAAADLAVWALIFIYSSPQSTRLDYPAIGRSGLLLPGCILFLIYAASAGLRTTLLRQKISVFETSQTMFAFLLAASSVLYFGPANKTTVLGAVCLLFSIACYAAIFALFGKAAEGRNYHVFATWAASLLVVGSVLCLPQFWLAACLGLAAITAPVSADRLTLKFHGLVFLLAAAVASGLLRYAFDALAGTLPARLGASVCLVSVCALVCYAAGKHTPQENWKQQLLHLIPAALSVFALAALLVEGLLWLIALRTAPEAHHVAFIRTLILCAAALALAFGGSRWRRLELTRMAYATLGVVVVKLLFEDLRLGHLEFIAASFFLFAITLIAVPRLARMGQKSSEVSQPSRKSAVL
jgi:hypothetical protein